MIVKMQIKKFLQRILSSRQRSKQKDRVISEIIRTPQKNRGVVNLHRIDIRNAGDYYSGPHHYFEELKGTAVDIFDYKGEDDEVADNFINSICNNSLIVGGGGLLNRGGFRRQLHLVEELTQKGKKTVLWGVGHNEKSPSTYGKVKNYNVDVSKFGLVGTRDVSMPGEWVPCVSCMHSIFDKKYEVTQETGVVFHKDTLKKPRITRKFQDYPTSSNTTDMDSLINFIGASEAIVTDSYHTMYWSMLMGKKVVAIPNSSKFYDFKYKPVVSNFDNCLLDLKKAIPVTGLLEECRDINKNFAAKVFSYLNL